MPHKFLLPDSTISGSADWTAVPGTPHYEQIDEIPQEYDGDTTRIDALTENAAIVFGFANPSPAIVDGDIVKAVRTIVEARTAGSGNDDLTVVLNGPITSNIDTQLLGSYRTQTNFPPDYADLTQAQIEALQATVTPTQQGMNVTVGHRVTGLAIGISYIQATPDDKEVVQIDDDASANSSSTSITFTFDQTATLGNVLVALVQARDRTGIDTPTGWTKQTEQTLTSETCAIYWKVSDGTETSVTFSTGTSGAGSFSMRFVELDWDGTTPTVANSTLVTPSNRSTSVTPDTLNNNVCLHWLTHAQADQREQMVAVDYTVLDEYPLLPKTTVGQNAFDHWTYHEIDAPGASSVTMDGQQWVTGQVWMLSVAFSRAAATIATGTITENETLFSATPMQAQTIATGTITENETLFALAPVATITIATGTITENETLFSSSPIPGGASIVVGTITENETLFAVAAVPGAVSVTTGLITENETLFAVAAVPGTVTVTTGLITENETLFPVAAIAGAVSITTGLITENEILFSATPRESQTVATGLITENEILFAATAVPGAVTITTGLITENETLFPVAVVSTVSVLVGTITENETLFAVTALAGAVTVTTGLIVENETLFAVTAVPGATSITTGLITENETLFPATPVAGGQSVLTGLITENETLFPATAVPGAVTVTTGLIVENETLFPAAPLVGAQFIPTGLIVENELLFSAVAVPGAITATTGLITENEILFPVAAVAVISIATGTIVENEILFSATPVPGAVSVATGLITENEALFAVAPAAVISITTGLIVENETLFPVTALAGGVTIATGLITENETLFSPTVGLAVLGGTYNAIEHFATGSTVTINLYDPVDGTPISVTDNACVEIPGTGIFIWDSSKLTTQPTGYQEYAWRMSDGTNFEGGVLRMFDAQDSVRLREIWQKMKLDPANPVETDEIDGSIRIGPNGAPIITIEGSTVGATPNRTTTQTRLP